MLVLAFLLTYISINDYRTHRITNSSILSLALLLYIFGTGEVRLFWLFSFVLISVLSVSALKVGGGDIKLIGVLIAFAQVDISLMNYLWGSLSCIVILVLLHRVSTKKWSGNIALAPAICVPFLITLL